MCNKTERCDPQVDEEAEEVVGDCRRIFQHEDEEILADDNGVKLKQRLEDESQSEDPLNLGNINQPYKQLLKKLDHFLQKKLENTV